MKSMKKIKNLLFSLLVVTLIGVTAISVNAAAKTIQLGTAKKITTPYIGGVVFSTKITTDGRYLYCVDMHRTTASNTSATLVKEMDRGVAEIIRNGYPNKSITGNAEKDYYITQTAVWWYLDETTGSSNLGNEFKKNGSDAYGMRSKVKELVNLGKQYRNTAQPTTTFEMSNSDNSLKLNDGYYVSQPIKVTNMNNVESYSVTMENAPEGTLIVDKSGNKISNFTKDTVLYVKVPADKVQNIDTDFKLTAKAVGYTYKAYEYQPTNKDMQNVALLEKVATTIPVVINLSIDSTKVSITKVDSNTKNPIEGAKLVLKDSNGKEITSWVSTTKTHVIRNLSNGTYTIEETEAPKGYVINKKVTTFTITDTNRNIDITIENAPQKPVVSIKKIDASSQVGIAGAVIVVKDSEGKEVKRFTSTTEATIFTDLAFGTYTVYEESAPAGYIKSDQVYSFTIDEDNLSQQILIENTKATIVPDTSTSSVLLTILGLAILGSGLRFVYKNGKKAN